jgi:ankyrin repeat protein
VDVVRAVIDMGGDVNAGSNDGITALILACQAGHLPVVNTLIDAGAVVADPKSPFQPFPVAEEAGHVDVLVALIKAGCDIATCDDQGATPLHRACLKGSTEVVEAMLEAGAEIDTVNTEGTPTTHTHTHIITPLTSCTF